MDRTILATKFNGSQYLVSLKYIDKLSTNKSDLMSVFSGCYHPRRDDLSYCRDIVHEAFNHSLIVLRSNVSISKRVSYCESYLNDHYPDISVSYEDLNDCIVNDVSNYQSRFALFRSKAYSNFAIWHWFITITYDSSKFVNEGDFRYKLSQTFKDLHNNYGWRVMGCFEKGSKNDRLHFHGLLSAPKMIGSCLSLKHYSVKHSKIHRYTENTYFKEKFGSNEFDDITCCNDITTANGRHNLESIINYVGKYIFKSGEHLFYSRHIDTVMYYESFTDSIFVMDLLIPTDFIGSYVISESGLSQLVRTYLT